MPYAGNFISRDNSLCAFDDADSPRSYDQFDFSELTDWSATNAGVTVTLENREYPLFYVFKILPNNTNAVSFQINNVTIGGVNVTNLNNMSLVGHALVKCFNSLTANTTLSVSSVLTSMSSSSAHTTAINPEIQTAVRSGAVSVNRNKSAVITSAYGNGSYITYYARNSYESGDSVIINDTGLAAFNYTTTPATIQYATPQMFTVSNSSTGYVIPTSSYSYVVGGSTEEVSQPFTQYSGENLTASLGFLFTGHSGQAIYLTLPVITDMNRTFVSWATRMSLETTPQVFREIDETSSPSWPMARLIHSISAGIEDTIDKFTAIARPDPTAQPGFVDIDDSANKSYLVDPDIALPKYYDWLLQIIGQTRSYTSIYSNKSADYAATIKVRCATTANITIATALNNGDTLDGVTLSTGDRVLVKNQSTASQNGIYIVGATPTRWSGMSASSASISAVAPVTPSLGYAQITTSAAHGFSVGDAVVIAGVTPSGYNGQYFVYSVPSTTTFVIETTQVQSATLSSATAKSAVNTTEPDLIFVREGTVNKMTMWSPQSQGWTGTAHGSTSITNDPTGAVRTNLVTNPSFETNTTGWGAYQVSNVRTAGTISGGVGSWSVVSTATATGAGGPFFNFTPTPGQTLTASIQCLRTSGTRSYRLGYEFYNSNSITAVSGNGTTVTYTTSTSHNFLAGNSVAISGITTTTAYNGTFTIASIPSSTTFTVTAGTTGTGTISGDETAVRTLAGTNGTASTCATSTRLSVTATVPATATNAYIILYSTGTGSIGDAIQIDAALLEQSSTVGDYFDGYNDSNSPWAIIDSDFVNFGIKQVAAKAATTSNITISTALNNADVIDGITLATGDYVLVKNQTTASENGIYQVASTPVRIPNLLAGVPLSEGFRTYVWGSGTENPETMFTLDADGDVGTSALSFTPTSKPFAWDDSDDFKAWQLTNKYFGYKAGSLEALEETVKRYLIGDKQVLITLNPPFEFIVYTLRDETPGIYYTSSEITSSEVITNALALVRPMGFNVTHSALSAFDTFIIGTSIIGTGRVG